MKKKYRILGSLGCIFLISIGIRVLNLYISPTIGIHESKLENLFQDGNVRDTVLSLAGHELLQEVEGRSTPWKTWDLFLADFYFLNYLMIDAFQQKIDAERWFHYDLGYTHQLDFEWSCITYQNYTFVLRNPFSVHLEYFNTTEGVTHISLGEYPPVYGYVNLTSFPTCNFSSQNDLWVESEFRELLVVSLNVDYQYQTNMTAWSGFITHLRFVETLIFDENHTLISIDISNIMIKNEPVPLFASYLVDGTIVIGTVQFFRKKTATPA